MKPEMLKLGGKPVKRALMKLFSSCLKCRRIPVSWKHAKMLLLHKKGDQSDISNDRPICLLPVIYKLFAMVLLNRIRNTLEEQQPVEQAGFCSGFSTTDHLHALNQLREKSREFKIPLYLAFVDFEKAFDSIYTKSRLDSLTNQAVDPRYVELLLEAYTGSKVQVSLLGRKREINKRS